MKSNKGLTIILSDGDNDYKIPLSKESDFHKEVNKLFSLLENSDEWYDACEEFDSKFGKYKI